MKKCVLHVHTRASDGQFNRIEICEMLLNKQHRDECENEFVVGFADHNCIPMEEEIAVLRSTYSNWEFPLCCEFSCVWKENEIHVLGLNMTRAPALQAFVDANQLSLEASKKHVDGLIQRINILGIRFLEDYDSLRKKYPFPRRISRTHIAQELVKQNLVPNIKIVYDEYLGDRGLKKAWVPKPLDGYHSLNETVDIILEHDGIPVLAHPMVYQRTGIDDLNVLISDFVAAGGMALECNAKEKETNQEVHRLAHEFGILICFGNDYHNEQDEFEVRDASFYISLVRQRDEQGGK